MNKTDFISLLPLLVISGAALLLMLVISVRRSHMLMYLLTLFSLIVAFAGIFITGKHLNYSPHAIDPLFVVDGLGMFSSALILLATLMVALLSYGYFEQRESRREEYYLLLLLAAAGALALVISRHFISVFLGLETLSVSLYGLIAYLRRRERSNEAGIKYLILAAFSSAFLLFGMALIYAKSGSMYFPDLAATMADMQNLSPVLLAGFGMMIVGIGFKLAVVPFHMWTADVYEGAPAPVTAFIATVSKGGMVIVLIRLFAELNAHKYPVLLLLFTVIAIASILAGNLLALLQNNVKRLLAYSSIAHLGYLLIAFIAGAQTGTEAVAFYLAAYFITILGAFGVLTALSDPVRDAERIEDYKGLLWKRPWLAMVFTAMLLSLAGIPLTAGFIGKFYIVAAGVDSSLWLPVIMLVIGSVIGLFYYLRVIVMMFQPPEPAAGDQPTTSDTHIDTGAILHPTFYVISGTTLAILTLLLVWFGVYPGYLMEMIREIAMITK